MYSQRLWGTPFATPQDVVHWLGAVQSQDYALGKWSVAQRADGITNNAMDRAIADGEILRTHVLRPTWHFVLPSEIRWILALTAPRVHALNAHRYRSLELDEDFLAKTNVILAGALEGGNHLTRQELAAALNRARVDTNGQRLAYMVMHAELDGIVCSGAPKGKRQTYGLLDERAPQSRTLDRDEALAELAQRYFTSRGPATLKDFLWWSSLTAADGRDALDMVGSRLRKEVMDGRTYWFEESSPRPRSASPVINLAQAYDERIVSYRESRDVPLGEVGMPHVVLLNGKAAGRWKPVRQKNSVGILTSLSRPLDRGEARALDAAVERYGAFIEVPVELL